MIYAFTAYTLQRPMEIPPKGREKGTSPFQYALFSEEICEALGNSGKAAEVHLSF